MCEIEPIRVLQCFTIMNRGGAETMIMNYYRKIDRKKVQFDFLVHREELGEYEEEIKKLGGKIYRMPSLLPQNFKKYKKEISIFLSEHPEYKVIHGNFSELGYFLYKEAKKQGVPTRIVHAHNYSKGFDMKSIFRFYWKIAMRSNVTHMFTCSEIAARWLFGKKNISKSIMMNNAIDSKLFSYDFQKSKRIKKELGLSDKFVIGHVGRFNIQKNHEFLIDIFLEVKKSYDKAILVLVGTGELEDRIKNKVNNLGLSKSVIFMGTKSNINDIMQAMDIFVFPSLFEGLGVVLVEAQASGMKCIVSDRVAKEAKITDLLEYIPLENSKTYWAEKILKYKNKYNRKDTFLDIVNSNFDINSNAKWLEEFYINEYKRNN